MLIAQEIVNNDSVMAMAARRSFQLARNPISVGKWGMLIGSRKEPSGAYILRYIVLSRIGTRQ